jgi:hypothetical protein
MASDENAILSVTSNRTLDRSGERSYFMSPSVRRYQWTLLEFAAAIVVAAIGFRWLETLPLIIPAALMYVANKTHFDRPARWLYVGAFPTAWFVAARYSVHHPGDEYGMAIVGLLPLCGWAARWIGHHGEPMTAISIFSLAGLVPAVMYGWAMDRARVKWWIFLPLVTIGIVGLTVWALSSYESYQRAMSKNGSLTAYISASALLTLPLAAILSTLIAVGVNWWHRSRETPTPAKPVGQTPS